MGIKGIYKEIGTGQRLSLTRLAVEKLEQTGRPLRLAIDISIWQFQVQAARGGCNPAIRTLFYRLLRLQSTSIQPIFVFDGPNKPAFKRNKRSSGRGDAVATAMAKRLIRLFGFQYHDAPGEAEAECALLQKSGIVDAVLSEDVDTIMFGCTRTLRNWSSETKGNTPTHVSMYDTEHLRLGASRLDREGMVLVALMSGGDYLPEGIPGAGVKLACEAARAGFGTSLCRLKRSDTSELASWKEWLQYELQHNESGFFRTRHKALAIPDEFPNMEILRYYTHPVVSSAATLDRLKQQTWNRPVDIQGLREFGRETFDWNYRIGAIKFIRVLAPGLLVRKLMDRSTQLYARSSDIETIEKEETELIKAITNRRTHFSTDATPELRVSFIPTDIVGYDFQNEPEELVEYGRDGLALNSDDELEVPEAEGGAEEVTKSTCKKPYSPTNPDMFWMPETIAKLGIPLKVEDWDEAQRAKAAKVAARSSPKASKTNKMPAGTLNNFVKVTKKNAQPAVITTTEVTKPAAPAPLVPTGNRLGSLAMPSQSLPSLTSLRQGPMEARTTSSRLPRRPQPSPRRLPSPFLYPLARLRPLARLLCPLLAGAPPR
ncbi:PIN domain-like protein [Xylariaceae sp. FL0804]|nr:PIN domain-like protein [Xylariaceae sp. FL0804]